jgi:beta-glucosidase/6-phospho-beta-glucosidase/beta-galactosidase
MTVIRSRCFWWKTGWVQKMNLMPGEIEDDYRISYLREHIRAMGMPLQTVFR